MVNCTVYHKEDHKVILNDLMILRSLQFIEFKSGCTFIARFIFITSIVVSPSFRPSYISTKGAGIFDSKNNTVCSTILAITDNGTPNGNLLGSIRIGQDPFVNRSGTAVMAPL